MFLEITAEGYVAIIGAVGACATVIAAAIVSVVIAVQNGKKLDAAAQRREEIASTVLDPSTATKTAPPAPPKV